MLQIGHLQLNNVCMIAHMRKVSHVPESETTTTMFGGVCMCAFLTTSGCIKLCVCLNMVPFVLLFECLRVCVFKVLLLLDF